MLREYISNGAKCSVCLDSFGVFPHNATTVKDFRDLLKAELSRRIDKNPRYSLRAFARDLNMGSARLSEVLNARAGISEKRALEIAEILDLDESTKEKFLSLVISQHSRSRLKRSIAQERVETQNTKTINHDLFQTISDWKHFAILETLRLKKSKGSSSEVAKILGLGVVEVRLAIERLERVGIVEKKRSRYYPNPNFIRVPSHSGSEGIRNYHKQILTKALESIDSQSPARRDLGSSVFAIDSSKIPELKKRIAEFRKSIVQLAQSSKEDRVYAFSTQLFDLSNLGEL